MLKNEGIEKDNNEIEKDDNGKDKQYQKTKI